MNSHRLNTLEPEKANHAHRKESGDLSRIAALTVAQFILVKSLGKYAETCVKESYMALAGKPLYSNQSGASLDGHIAALLNNCCKLVRKLEHDLMLWLVGKKQHPMRKVSILELSLMDSEASDMEVLKARMESQLNDYVHLEISDFQQRWKKVLAEEFDPEAGIVAPLYQGLFIVEFIRGMNLPEEITEELVSHFVEGFPAECKKIHIELIDAFKAMGIKSGGWEVYNGKERMPVTQQF